MPSAVELRPDYEYEHDASLFEGEELNFGKIIRRLGIPRAIGKRAAHRMIAVRLTMDLNGVLNASRQAPDWPKWKHDDGDRTRVFTPPFQTTTEADGRTSVSRLHVVLPGGMLPQPIVHIEKVLPSEEEGETMQVISGPEIVWNLGRADIEMPMIGIGDKDNEWMSIGPERNSQFFLNTFHAIHDARQAFG
jgi:hypothetical protein